MYRDTPHTFCTNFIVKHGLIVTKTTTTTTTATKKTRKVQIKFKKSYDLQVVDFTYK